MKVLVDCRSLDLRCAKGLENFAVAIIEGLALKVRHVVLDVCKTSLKAYEKQFAAFPNVSFICDPLQGLISTLSEKGRLGELFAKTIHRIHRQTGLDLRGRRASWARKVSADVVYYPSHRDSPQHDHLRMVTTIHAVLPEYSEREMAIIESHIIKARAIVTSWPHPLTDLLHRYPGIADHAFLVPYTASHFVMTHDCNGTTCGEFGNESPYYLYASAVYPRKNHRALIEACVILDGIKSEVPIILCTGGGDLKLQIEMQELIDKFDISDRIRFVGHVDSYSMADLYYKCSGTISASLWEAGSAPLHEGAALGKPHLGARIDPTEEHVRMLGAGVAYFDPNSPEDIAKSLIHFTENLEIFTNLMKPAIPVVHAIDARYMGSCYADIMGFAANFMPRPPWFPFLHPLIMKDNAAKYSAR